jgi:hypothetical protein
LSQELRKRAKKFCFQQIRSEKVVSVSNISNRGLTIRKRRSYLKKAVGKCVGSVGTCWKVVSGFQQVPTYPTAKKGLTPYKSMMWICWKVKRRFCGVICAERIFFQTKAQSSTMAAQKSFTYG